MKSLSSPSKNEQIHAIESCAREGLTDAIPRILLLLQSSVLAVVRTAIAALGSLKAPQAVRPLMDLLAEGGDLDVCRDCLRSLAQIGGKRVVTFFAELLDDPRSPLHMPLVDVLGEGHVERSLLPRLSKLLFTETYPFKAPIARVLLRHPDMELEKTFLRLKESNDPELVCLALEGLRRFASPRNYEQIWRLLSHPTARIVITAAETLVAYDPATASRDLAKALATVDGTAAVKLLNLLATHGGSAQTAAVVEQLERGDGRIVAAALQALKWLGAVEVEALLPAVDSTDLEVRRSLAEVLGTQRTGKAVDMLAALTRDANHGVRLEAVRALAQIQDDRAAQSLLAALEDEHPRVREAACLALSEEGSRAVRDGLVSRLEDSSAPVRKAALESLRHYELSGLTESLTRASFDEDLAVRQAAGEVLGLASTTGNVSFQQALDYLETDQVERGLSCLKELMLHDPRHVEGAFTLGRLLWTRGDAEEAERYLARVVELSPRHAKAHRLLAEIAKLQGRLEREESHLRQALELAPHVIELQRDLGLCLADRGKSGESLRHLETYLAEEPNDRDVRLALARGFLAAKRAPEARRQLERLLLHDGFDGEALAMLGELLAEVGLLEEAQRRLETALDVAPPRAEWLRSLARIQARRERWDEAVETYKRLSDEHPLEDVDLELARALLARRHPGEAAERLQRHLESHPQSGEALDLLAEALEQKGQFHQALETLFELHALHPAWPSVLMRVGRIYSRNGQPRQAVQCFREHLKLHPDDYEALLVMASVELDAHHYKEALVRLSRCVQLRPDDARAIWDTARTYLALGDRANALEYGRRLLEVDPRNVETFNFLAHVHGELGDLDTAAELYEKSLDVNPEQTHVRRQLGALRFGQKSFTQAVYHLHRVSPSYEDDEALCMELGSAYLELGHLDNAHYWLSKAERLEAGHPDVLRATARLALERGELDRALSQSQRLLAVTDEDRVGVAIAGLALNGRGAHDAACPFLRRALRADGSREDVREALAESLFAIGRHEELLDLYPDMGELPSAREERRCLIARSYMALGGTAEAEKILEAMLDANAYLVEGRRALAEIKCMRGEYLEAERILNFAIRIAPAEGDLRIRRATILAERKQHAAAKVDLLHALELGCETPEIHRLLGRIETEQGHLNQALKHYDVYTRLTPTDPRGHAARAALYEELGQMENAVESLRNVVELDRNDTEARLRLGQLQLELGASDEARESLEEYLRLAEDREPALRKLAELAEVQGDFEAARKHLEELVAVADQPRAAMERLVLLLFAGKLHVEAWKLLSKIEKDEPGVVVAVADAIFEQGDWVLGRDLQRKVFEIDPRNYDALYKVAVCHLKRRDRQRGRNTLAKVLEYCPGHARANEAMARLHLTAGDDGAARSFLEQAVSSDPTSVWARNRLARLFLKANDPLHAREQIRESLRFAPDDAVALALAGDAAYALHEDEEAMDAYRRSFAAQPSAAVAHKLSKLYEAAGRLDRAIAVLSDYDARRPDFVRIQRSLGRLLLDVGRNERAVEVLERAHRARWHGPTATRLVRGLLLLDRDEEAASHNAELLRRRPTDLEALLAAAELGRRHKKYDMAETWLRRCLENHPGDPRAPKLLAEIYESQARYHQAYETAQRALALCDDDAEVHHLCGRLAMKQKLVGRARQHLERALELAEGPLADRIRLLLAENLAESGRDKQALELLGTVEGGEARWHALRRMIDVALAGHAWEEGRERAIEYLREFPSDYPIHEKLGICLLHLGVHQKAQRIATMLFDRSYMPEMLVEALVDGHLRSGKASAAEQVLIRALEKKPDATSLLERLAELRLGENRLEEAERTLRMLLQTAPGHVGARERMLDLLEKTGRYEAMRSQAKALLDGHPYSITGLTALGRAHLLLEEPQKALQAFRRSTQLRPHHAKAHLGMAQALSQLGDDEEAIRALEQSLRLDEGDEQTRWELGAVYDRLGRGDLATYHYETLLSASAPGSRYASAARRVLEGRSRPSVN